MTDYFAPMLWMFLAPTCVAIYMRYTPTIQIFPYFYYFIVVGKNCVKFSYNINIYILKISQLTNISQFTVLYVASVHS